jgi:hypothetical protein
MCKNESVVFVPPERKRLEPFATIFLEVVIPEAARNGWLDSGATPPTKELQNISRRIESQLKIHGNQQLHPAIWVHALLVCVHFFYQSASTAEHLEDQECQAEGIDAACSLLQHLKLHHDLYDLYLRIS